MTLLELFSNFSSHLIEFMGAFLCLALFFRFIAFKSGKKNAVYFRTLSRSLEKKLNSDSTPSDTDDVESWLKTLLNSVRSELPQRSIRLGSHDQAVQGNFRNQGKKSFKDFMNHDRDILHNIASQSDALRAPFPPNFDELSNRVLNKDPFWTRILGVVPIDTLQRILSIMPGLFIIGGIFGTFIGITAALPMIATIDLGDLDAAGPILNAFVANIAFSMKTSIAGIIYSVILTLLNTLFPIASMRSEVREGVARTFEHIWNRVHNDKLSPGETEIVNGIEKLCGIMSQQNYPESVRKKAS